MKKGISKIIEKYYNKAFNENLIDQNILKSKGYVFGSLYESCHETITFDDAIEDIIVQLQSNNSKEFYTGWNYYRNENICIKQNDENINIPIYIIKENAPSGKYAEIANRDTKDEITSNAIIIIVYLNRCKTLSELYGILKHEMFHALEMYIDKNFNILDLPKNAQGNNITNDFNLEEMMLRIFSDALYQLSLAEQRAKINGAIGYLKKVKRKSTGSIEQLIDISDDFNQLNNFIKISQIFYRYFQNQLFYRILILGYYMQKYKLTNDKEIIRFCDFETINQIYINYMDTHTYNNVDDCKNVSQHILNAITHNRLAYQMKLYSAIYNNL